MHTLWVFRRVVWPFAVLGAALSCGESFNESAGPALSRNDAGTTPAQDDEVPTGIELDAVPALLADAYCASLERCLGALAELFVGSDCARELTRTIEDQGWNELTRAVEEGRVMYDGTAIPACLATIDARACEDTNDRALPECEAALGGLAELGDACTVDEECEGSLSCDRSVGCPGECVAPRRPGEPCSEDDMCADGLSCSEQTGLCVRPAASGEACGGDVERECQAGLFCVGDDEETAMQGQCVAIADVFSGTAGEECNLDRGELCEDDLACVVDQLIEPRFECKPKAEPGEPCSVGLPDQCPATHYCTAALELGIADGVCAPLPEAGEPCVTTLLGKRCASGAFCGPEGECMSRARLGEPCQLDLSCYSGFCVEGACAAPGGCAD
jgi:hypothetical protein